MIKKYPLRIFLLFTVLTLIIFWPILMGKVNLNGNLLVSYYPPYSENLPFKNTGWDQLRIYFPFYQVTFEQFRNFIIPLWNPYAFSGHPHAADFQSAVFYPLNVFGLFLPQIELWHLLRVTPTILASFFMFLYLRSLKLVKIAAIFGALTFGFSPFILTWGEEVVMSPHSILWLPLILLAIERFDLLSSRHPERSEGSQTSTIRNRLLRSARNDKKWYLLIISLSTAFSFLAGYMQTSIYLFIFVAFYILFRLGLKPLFTRDGAKLIGAFVLGAMLAAIQLVISAEIFVNSARSQIALTETLFEFLVPVEGLLTFIAPDFFGHPATYNMFRGGSAQYYEAIMFSGIAALLFALYSIYAKYKDKLVLFLTVFVVVSLSTTLDLPTSRLFLSLPIPFLSTSIANRILFIDAFCIATLGAIGLNEWLTKGGEGILRVVAALAVVYIFVIGYLLAAKQFGLPYFERGGAPIGQTVNISLRNMVIPFGVFTITTFLVVFATFFAKFKKNVAILIIFIAFLHIFYFSWKYFSFSDRKYVFPTSPELSFIRDHQENFRSWGIGDAFFEVNFASQYGLYWPEGYDSLNNKSYGEFTYAMQGQDLSSFTFRADASLGRSDTATILGSEARRRLVDMVGVKYVIGKNSESELITKNNFKKVFEGNKYSVFENLQVVPRVMLASNYEGPPDFKDDSLSDSEVKKIRRSRIFEKLTRKDFDFRNTVILEEPSPISPQFGEGSAQITRYEPSEVVVKTRSEQPKLLVLSDNYFPGWKATVDGDEVKILRANYTFRAVPLTPGEHSVRFVYDPLSFKLGVIVSAVSLGALVVFFMRPRFKLT
ncbi:MAG: YfhO family protein [Candidatus Curtissbacteria bacterium]|nr:YfhO family protein [Candidatus Curtissbacteria bacterium]